MESTVCNLCGANCPRLLHRNFDLDISACLACGLVYAGPRRLTREETWARYSATYFENEYLPAFGVTGNDVDLAAFDARYARTLAWIRPARGSGTLLEIGCGAGFFLKAAERDGWTVTGLEVMEAGAAFARERLGLTVMSTAIEEAELPESSYDVVAMFEVIEHLSDPKAILARARTLLRPGGCLVVSTPNVESLSHRILGNDWAVMNPVEHLHYFSEVTLGAMLERCGFTDARFDREYAGAGRYETTLPTHAFTPSSPHVRSFKWRVDQFPSRVLRFIQSRGMADGLHCLAFNPGPNP